MTTQTAHITIPSQGFGDIHISLQGDGNDIPTGCENAIRNGIKNIQQKIAQDDLINMKEVLAILGPLGYTYSTISKWIMKAKRGLHTFPIGKKIGKRRIFSRQEIIQWLTSKR